MRAYTLGIYEKALPGNLSWREKLQAAKEAGYDFMEISIDESEEKLARLNMSREERLDLVKTMYEVGVPIRTMCLSGHRKYPLGSSEPKVCKRGMDIMEKAIQLADDLGIRIIQLAGYDVYYEESTIETRKRFEKNLKLATLMSARAGVLMGFETMETEFMNTVEKSMKYVSMVNSTYLNVYPDAGNITNAAVRYGTCVEEDLKSGSGHITSVHLKETVPGKFREIPFGTGHVDFENVIKTSWELGIRKFVTEFWYVGQKNWKEDVFHARKMIGSMLDKQMQEDELTVYS